MITRGLPFWGMGKAHVLASPVHGTVADGPLLYHLVSLPGSFFPTVTWPLDFLHIPTQAIHCTNPVRSHGERRTPAFSESDAALGTSTHALAPAPCPLSTPAQPRPTQRPSLGTAWEPFYSSSPSLSAHSTASIASLQGKAPLPGHPKTLRDLTHATELLTLPAAFGAIQLGETFACCLAVNSDVRAGMGGPDADAVAVRVEMQTASARTVLAELGGPALRLRPGESLEQVVSHEIKELGQHVLGCTVSYRAPPGVRAPPGAEGQEPGVLSFRKFYKFAVSYCLYRVDSRVRS